MSKRLLIRKLKYLLSSIAKELKKKIFWLILMGFRIFRILNKWLYLVYLWGGPLFFWKIGDENFSKTDNYFSVSLSVKIYFFSSVIFL